MIIQTSVHILQVDGYDVEHLMEDVGFLEFSLSTAFQNPQGKMVLPEGLHQDCVIPPDHVNVGLALLEPTGHFAVSYLGVRVWFVGHPQLGWMGQRWLCKGAFCEYLLLQVCYQCKHHVHHSLVHWFLCRGGTFLSFSPQGVG